MTKDLGKGYKYKKIKIEYRNGDIYKGMGAAYYSSEYEPYGEGTYYQKASGVTFHADWDYRRGPNFETINIISKPKGESFVLVQAHAGQVYGDLSHLDIIEAKVGSYNFKNLPSIIIEPHAWSGHLFVIKKVTEYELTFDFTGHNVDHGHFIDCVAEKGKPKEIEHSESSTIIWDHDDEYEVSRFASIKVLYF